MDGEVLTHSITKSLELWSIISFYDLFLLFLLLGVILHFAEGYYNETLKSYKIRMSKENWSILFFMMRDFSLFAAFGIALLLINPDMFADVKFPLPFFPIGEILLGAALIFKLRGRLTTSSKDRKLFEIFLLLSIIVQYLGFVLVMEAAPEEWVNAGLAGNFWTTLAGMRSNVNPELSMITFYLTFPVLMIIVAIMLKIGMTGKQIEKDQFEKI